MIWESFLYLLQCLASPVEIGKFISIRSFSAQIIQWLSATECLFNLFFKKLLKLCLPFRHRAVNLFLQGYEKSWIETEEHYFEDKLIEDLAVCFYWVKRWKKVWAWWNNIGVSHLSYSVKEETLLQPMGLRKLYSELLLRAMFRENSLFLFQRDLINS